MTGPYPSEPLIRILMDTNVFISMIIFQSDRIDKYLDNLIYQQEHGLIELIVPKVVQAELYGILRAGRVRRRNQPIILSHHQIIYLFESYFDALFDRDYFDRLGRIQWPVGESYKEIIVQLVAEEYGWTDLGQAYIEQKMRHPVDILGLKDRFDFPIMAASLYYGVDLIVTKNMRDFVDPFGRIRVMTLSKAIEFDHYQLHLPYDTWENET